jgi:arsenate reductase-like glutaredoxin family protein
MNIQASSLAYMSQVSSISNYSRQNTQDVFSSNQNQSDKISFSSEGKAMSRLLNNQETSEAREAQKAAFQEAYSEFNIESLDTENMTDEEIQEVLQSFETSMNGYMKEGFTSASEMNSTELKDAVSNISDMAASMDDDNGQYGPPSMGGKGGPGKGGPPKGGGPGKSGGVQETESSDNIISTLLEALEEDEDDEDTLADQLLEAIEESEQENFYTSSRSMQEMLALLNPAV